MEDRFLKRLRKKAKKGMRGWPIASIAFYGPDLSRASKVVVGIKASAEDEPMELRNWRLEERDVRNDPVILQEILNFMESHSARSVVMVDRIIGCPHQEDVDYEGEWCPICTFWRGRDRFTGKLIE